MSIGSEGDDFNAARSELFEALGHPVRIKILQALVKEPLSFSKLKAAVDIGSSGHLSFHLGKLGSLVRVNTDGNYSLTDDGREALRLASMAVQPPAEGRSTVRQLRSWGGTPRLRWLAAALVVCLILGSVLALSYIQPALLGGKQSNSSSANCTVPSTSSNDTYVTGTVHYPPSLLGSIYDQLNRRYSEPEDYINIFSPVYFNSSALAFTFRFEKNSHFDPEMYGGNLSGTGPWVNYPAVVWMGTEGGLLFVLAQVMNIYGSPYSLDPSVLSPLVLMTRFGNQSLSLGAGAALGFGIGPIHASAITPDGLYGDYSGGFSLGSGPVSPYYYGPQTWNDPMNGSYNPGTPPVTEGPAETWEAATILGNSGWPFMTRFLYAINMSQIPELATDSATTCPYARMMLSLQASTGNPIPEQNGMSDFLALVDNFPSHSPVGPFDLGSYLNVYVKTHYPTQAVQLESHSVVLLSNFVYQHSLTSANESYSEGTFSLKNFSLPYPGYLTLSGNATGELNFGIRHISVNGYTTSDFAFFGNYPVSAGNASLIVQLAFAVGGSRFVEAHFNLVYHYWTS